MTVYDSASSARRVTLSPYARLGDNPDHARCQLVSGGDLYHGLLDLALCRLIRR